MARPAARSHPSGIGKRSPPPRARPGEGSTPRAGAFEGRDPGARDGPPALRRRLLLLVAFLPGSRPQRPRRSAPVRRLAYHGPCGFASSRAAHHANGDPSFRAERLCRRGYRFGTIRGPRCREGSHGAKSTRKTARAARSSGRGYCTAGASAASAEERRKRRPSQRLAPSAALRGRSQHVFGTLGDIRLSAPIFSNAFSDRSTGWGSPSTVQSTQAHCP